MKKVNDVYKDKIFAVMGYLWILCIIPLVFRKDNRFVLAHSKQGLVIFVGIVCVFVASIVFEWILRPGLFIFGIASICGIIKSIQGKDLKIPLIYQVANKIIL